MVPFTGYKSLASQSPYTLQLVACWAVGCWDQCLVLEWFICQPVLDILSGPKTEIRGFHGCPGVIDLRNPTVTGTANWWRVSPEDQRRDEESSLTLMERVAKDTDIRPQYLMLSGLEAWRKPAVYLVVGHGWRDTSLDFQICVLALVAFGKFFIRDW